MSVHVRGLSPENTSSWNYLLWTPSFSLAPWQAGIPILVAAPIRVHAPGTGLLSSVGPLRFGAKLQALYLSKCPDTHPFGPGTRVHRAQAGDLPSQGPTGSSSGLDTTAGPGEGDQGQSEARSLEEHGGLG